MHSHIEYPFLCVHLVYKCRQKLQSNYYLKCEIGMWVFCSQCMRFERRSEIVLFLLLSYNTLQLIKMFWDNPNCKGEKNVRKMEKLFVEHKRENKWEG